jgi:galactosylceramidase
MASHLIDPPMRRRKALAYFSGNSATFAKCPAFFAVLALLPGLLQATPVVEVSLSSSDHGRIFEGIGAVSAGASSKLLIDYAEPYRSDILDFLFKPHFGAGFQHLKVEVGGGENSTCGSEPSHVLSQAELANPQPRGYEFWLMREARRRNPRVLLDCLPWSYPAWVQGPFTQHSTDWLIAFLDLAKAQQTPLDWLSAGWNERGTNRDWIVKSLRPSLDARGYQNIKLQAPDDIHKYWAAFNDVGDIAYQNIISAEGYHYVNGRVPWVIDEPGHPSTPTAKDSGKELWASEEWGQSGEEWETHGAMLLARIINNMYSRDRIVKTEIWCPIDSIYPGLPWDTTGAMRATSPWSGYYVVWPAIWALAQTTQFAQPGWQYLDHACGQILPSTWKGSYVSLKNPATGDWSTIVCTDTPVRFSFKVDPKLKMARVHVWSSSAQSQFVQQPDLTPNATGRFGMDLRGDSIYSFTTTTGQHKGEPPHPIPADQPFPTPFREDFQSYASGQTPKYFSDQKGTFEVATDPEKGKCLAQIVPAQGTLWATGLATPYTIFGDQKWSNYTVNADVKIEGGDVEIGGRYEGKESRLNLAYRWTLTKKGAWTLAYETHLLVSGIIPDFRPDEWHHLKLVLHNSEIQGWIDGQKKAQVQGPDDQTGMVDLASSYNRNLFANISVTP